MFVTRLPSQLSAARRAEWICYLETEPGRACEGEKIGGGFAEVGECERKSGIVNAESETIMSKKNAFNCSGGACGCPCTGWRRGCRLAGVDKTGRSETRCRSRQRQ